MLFVFDERENLRGRESNRLSADIKTLICLTTNTKYSNPNFFVYSVPVEYSYTEFATIHIFGSVITFS